MNRVFKTLVIGGVVLLAAVGCSKGLVRPRIEKGIRDALPQYIGPAKGYSVRADGSTTDMLNGLIKRLHIEGQEVQLDPALLVRQIVIDMDEVRYNTKRQVTSVGATTFSAELTEESVNRYITTTNAAQYKVKVKLLPGGDVEANFVPNILGIDIAVSLTGKPEIAGADKVNFVADKTSVAHLPIPAFAVNKILAAFNPILDMSVMKFPVTLNGITIKQSVLQIRGNADFRPGEIAAK